MKYSVREIEKTVCQILDEVSYGKVESSDLDFETDLLKLAIDFLNERRKEDGKPEYEISRSIERARDISKYTE